MDSQHTVDSYQECFYHIFHLNIQTHAATIFVGVGEFHMHLFIHCLFLDNF